MSQQASEYSEGKFWRYIKRTAVIAVCVYLGYVLGNWHEVERASELNRSQASIASLSEENDQLTRRLNVLNVELEVSRLASKDAQQQILEQQQQQAEMARQLGFYQRVMAPEKTQDGFVIEAFDVTPSLTPGLYRFELALMQQTRNKAVVKGNLSVEISGSESQQAKSYSLTELMPGESDPLTFSFKYFQVITGELRLPEGFLPEQVTVDAEIFQFKRKRGDLSTTLPWTIASND